MMRWFRLPYRYLRYYRKQTIALWLGMLLSAALFTGIGSLLGSGRIATTNKAISQYGRWQYSFGINNEQVQMLEELKNKKCSQYIMEKVGIITIRKTIEEPFEIELVHGNSDYMEMMGRTLISGKLPSKEDEVAMDIHTLNNLDLPKEIGSEVLLDGDVFHLSGIVEAGPEKLFNKEKKSMQVFVNETLDYKKNGTFAYVYFDVNHNINDQMYALANSLKLELDNINRNNGITSLLIPVSFTQCIGIIQTALENKDAGLPYVWGQMNQSGQVLNLVVLSAIGIFATIIIYSLYRITITKRIAEYSILQTIGMTDGLAFRNLLIELVMIALFSYPVGTLIGNVIGFFIYQKSGNLFVGFGKQIHTGSQSDKQALLVENLPDAGKFLVSWNVIYKGAIILFIVLVGICFCLMKKMKKYTIRQMASMDTQKHRNRKIYSLKKKSLTTAVTKRFMFSQKRTFVGILFSLSVGSIIFLGTTYVTENSKVNNELTFKTDDGLGSDISMYIDSDTMKEEIAETMEEEIAQVEGIKEIHPVRYQLGEVAFENGSFRWPQFFPETSEDEKDPPNPELMSKYNGIAVKSGKDDYKIKINLYGYDDDLLKQLEEYLLEGSIEPDSMRKNNTVIFKTIMDGVGNYDSVSIHPGDPITIRTIKQGRYNEETCRFLSEDENYQNQELKICALVNRPLAKVDTYIGDNGTDQFDVIMTSEQMERLFGTTGYQTISISLDKKIDSNKVIEELAKITQSLESCIVKDYTKQIKVQNLYLKQKMYLFYGVAFLLLLISMIHIVNSMQHLILTRKHEFTILRAMGITDAGFNKMLAKEGLRYGVYSSIAVFILYVVIQRVLYYMLTTMYLYVHANAWISPMPIIFILFANHLICVGVTVFAGQGILKENVVIGLRE